MPTAYLKILRYTLFSKKTILSTESANLFATHFLSVYNCEKISIENSVLEPSTFDLPNNVSFSV